MFRLLFLVTIVLTGHVALGQKDIIEKKEREKVFEKVEIIASTDEKEWNRHIQRYSKLPDSIQQKIPNGSYRVAVQFVINQHGDLGSVEAKSDPGFGLAKIAENIVRSYRGKWQPASQCGRSVKASRLQPIVFVVNNLKTL